MPVYYLHAAGKASILLIKQKQIAECPRSVFRDMISSLRAGGKGVKTANEIRFTGDKIESSSSIRLFLDVVSRGTLDYYLQDHPERICEDIINATLFVRKYDCQAAAHIISTWLWDSLRVNRIGNVDLFLIACRLDMDTLAGNLIFRMYGNGRPVAGLATIQPTWGNLDEPGIFALDNLSPGMWASLNKQQLRAIAKARSQPNANMAKSTFLILAK